MSEKRFIVLPNNVVWDNQLEEVVCRCILEGIGDSENVCQRLNEQQSIIEYLTKSRDKYKELLNSFLFYCKCYEKAIERAFEEKHCLSEEDINRIYEELEKELEDE